MRRVEAVSGGCPAKLSACLCKLAPDHEGPHQCACQGSWNTDGSIVSLPQTGDREIDAMGDLLTALLGNDTTLAAMRDVETGTDLIEADSMDELLTKLED